MKLMSPKNFNPKQSSPRHVITKLSKTEDKDFKTSKRKKKKNLSCKGTSQWISQQRPCRPGENGMLKDAENSRF